MNRCAVLAIANLVAFLEHMQSKARTSESSGEPHRHERRLLTYPPFWLSSIKTDGGRNPQRQMSNHRGSSKVSVRKGIALKPMDASELATVERTLARLVALAYAGDHGNLVDEDEVSPTTSATISTES